MKGIIKISLLLSVVLFLTSSVLGQDTLDFAVVWPLTDPSTGGSGASPQLSGMAYADAQALMNMEINHYSGVSASQRTRMIGNAWPALQTEAIDSVYMEYRIRPKGYNDLHISRISLNAAAASITTMKVRVTAGNSQNPFALSEIYGNLPTTEFIPVSIDTAITVSAGDTFLVRLYPWVDNESTVKTGKYFCVQDLKITGTSTGEAVYDPAVVQTVKVDEVSDLSALAEGRIIEDGGSPVESCGFVIAAHDAPDTSDRVITADTLAGSFSCRISGLTKGTDYRLRAFALNRGGVAYGTQLSFTTLDSLTVPLVYTGSVSSVLADKAEVSGFVSSWGGTEVLRRGICWSRDINPDMQDQSVEIPGGTGVYTLSLTGLSADTDYHVRAYAENAQGMGFGQDVSFRTQLPAPDIYKSVSAGGDGDYRTVQAAFDAVPEYYTGRYTIFVHSGTYREKLLLPRNRIHVLLVGEDAENTILSYDDYAGIAGGTSNSASVTIDADDFTAVNLTFQNTVQNDGTAADQQAVALKTNGDRQAYYSCRILGYQDTYYAAGSYGTDRIYMKNCVVEGSVDFIFGRDIVIFDSCEIRINREGGTLTAASTDADSRYGLTFRDCRITTVGTGFDGRSISSFVLGRPWQGAPRTVYIRCDEPASVNPSGWTPWNVTPALYGEYDCSGPGYLPAQRNPLISRQLSAEEAAQYTDEQIFSRSSNPRFAEDWAPSNPLLTELKVDASSRYPDAFRLFQNFPNPFNSRTRIRFQTAERSTVSLFVYDIRGRQVYAMKNLMVDEGSWELTPDLTNLASGVYIYELLSGSVRLRKKMCVIK